MKRVMEGIEEGVTKTIGQSSKIRIQSVGSRNRNVEIKKYKVVSLGELKQSVSTLFLGV